MKVNHLIPKGLILFEPRIFTDDRGYFFESFNTIIKNEIGTEFEFIQDNESSSAINVLRGLHYQIPPYEQGKLVRVINGKVLDVVVDMRKSSPTFGTHYSIELSGIAKSILWIPPGFAHGFVTLQDQTIFSYKCTKPYHKQSETGILWNDKTLQIDWKIKSPILSAKDLELPSMEDAVSYFE